MNAEYAILFFGETLPGHDPVQARARLQALLHCDPDLMDEVFSGQQVTLRRGLAPEKALRYQYRLEEMGLHVVIDPPPPPGVQYRPGGSTAELTQLPSPSMAPVEEMTCPNCGERQPRRVLCRNCAVDMPRALAARLAGASEDARNTSPPPSATWVRVADNGRSSAVLGLGFLDFGGRLGRRAYAMSALGCTILALFVALMSLHFRSLALLAAGWVPLAVYGLRLMVVRCHDLGWSGWWSVLGLTPYVGAVFIVALALVPGEPTDNDWGVIARPPSMPAFFSTMVLLGVVSLPLITHVVRDFPQLRTLSKPAETEINVGGERALFMTLYDPKRDDIVIYSLSHCDECVNKRRLMDNLGVRYREYLIDLDSAAEGRLDERLRKLGLHGGMVSMPVFEVNGSLLPNNPSLADIARHLRRTQG